MILIGMILWMIAHGYQYLFLNGQGAKDPELFDLKNFAYVFILIIIAEIIAQVIRNLFSFLLGLEISQRMTTLSNNLISY